MNENFILSKILSAAFSDFYVNSCVKHVVIFLYVHEIGTDIVDERGTQVSHFREMFIFFGLQKLFIFSVLLNSVLLIYCCVLNVVTLIPSGDCRLHMHVCLLIMELYLPITFSPPCALCCVGTRQTLFDIIKLRCVVLFILTSDVYTAVIRVPLMNLNLASCMW